MQINGIFLKKTIDYQAVGSEGETLPEHVGMPLGEEFGGATYFMLESHYDNPAMHKNIVDNSGKKLTVDLMIKTVRLI